MKQTPRLRTSLIALGWFVFLSLLAMLTLAPVPSPSRWNTFLLEGQVEAVIATRSGDVQIRLVDDPRTYYVNRGVESGLAITHLSRQLEGQKVQIRVIKRTWSPLDPLHRLMPIAKLEVAEEVIY